MLQMVEPTELPRAKSALPRVAATTATTISGVVVARLTRVEPMTTFGSRRKPAIRTAAETKRSPPFTRSAMPTASRMRSEIMKS